MSCPPRHVIAGLLWLGVGLLRIRVIGVRGWAIAALDCVSLWGPSGVSIWGGSVRVVGARGQCY